MRHGRKWVQAACGAGLFMLCCLASCPRPASAASCDEYDPHSPAQTTRITLDATDLVDRSGDEMRSFVATGSLGKVDATVVSSTPPGIVRDVSAVPQVSHLSPDYGEQLKGIAVSVHLRRSSKPATVVLRLRQVCAQYFRSTFLYY